MKKINIHLGGYLNFYDHKKRSRFTLSIHQKMGLIKILEQLQIPSAEIALVSINSELAILEIAEVHPGDDVEFYPPMGGG